MGIEGEGGVRDDRISVRHSAWAPVLSLKWGNAEIELGLGGGGDFNWNRLSLRCFCNCKERCLVNRLWTLSTEKKSKLEKKHFTVCNLFFSTRHLFFQNTIIINRCF